MNSFNFAREIGMIRMEQRQRSVPRMTDGLFPAVLEKNGSGWTFSSMMLPPVLVLQHRCVNDSVLNIDEYA